MDKNMKILLIIGGCLMVVAFGVLVWILLSQSDVPDDFGTDAVKVDDSNDARTEVDV